MVSGSGDGTAANNGHARRVTPVIFLALGKRAGHAHGTNEQVTNQMDEQFHVGSLVAELIAAGCGLNPNLDAAVALAMR